MTLREVAFVVEPLLAHEAEGVVIRRTIGSERLAVLDPFMLLDHLTLEKPAEGRIGFPRHPHRGIETLSYVIDGRVFHKDSIGNEDNVGKDEAQWMTAGRGIWHEEMLEADQGKVEMLQLWFSLPQADKMIAPGYAPATQTTIPTQETNGATVRIYAGKHGGQAGPFDDIRVQPKVLQIDLEPGATVHITTNTGATTAAYVFRGQAQVGTRTTEASRLIVFTRGEAVEIQNPGPTQTRLLFISADALSEPIVQYRSFVMNSPEDIRQVEKDIESGEFGNG